ncbi:protein phosphatase 2C domain-containing protein [Sphaerospermopsis aphanizomenoides BCCUSP55]|uniref:PP2C family protein-serine/threonine phosphatase n=1 Tax=Sphaerospermopsis aphanizomenoides TaxID=459663 RepID=UPI0019049588|nr:protein phosphatase 2C domain-containing protein [Sphaerospermopsis aphanizomenoides]MBK1989559.1 protein phosphatase 2C domain-containing protein [Sphaerospermopsis aphanizomenoides BCCUSP55]
MENDAATLSCPNEYCQAANPLTHKYCQRCSTSLPKRYLWAVGESLNLGSPGEILADRYLVISESIIFDLKPGLVPQIPELDYAYQIKAYLKLIPYRLHIPQVYGILSLDESQSQTKVLLLEKPPLQGDSTDSQVNLCHQLTTAWGDASSMRQMNWLWQMANLWQPLLTEGVASSLLSPHLLRVEGALVRLLELHFDSPTAPTLSQLGAFWEQLVKDAKPAIAEFLKQISDALIQGEISSSEQLIAVLDQGLAGLGTASSGRNAPTQSTSIKIITQTDTGPSRQRNEDACYPSSGILVSKPPQQTAFAIVCDGIGGHEGGNIASNLAIETIHQQITQLTSVPYENIDPLLLLNDLEQAVSIVNDKISQRNDTEHRQGRQRMGTTLVMALPIAHEIYITHIGDSRAYWITRHGCYQVTLDDDVASREVRLGYAIYREALQHSGAGSLVQALGMSKSASLHPTSQRFIIDEDAVFLLTTDGLSDFDRVEESWETEILPVLAGDTNIENVASRLIEIANTKNGHDNSTIALVHYQVKYTEPEIKLQAYISAVAANKTVDLTSRATDQANSDNTHQQTQVIPETKPVRAAQLPLQLLIICGVLLAAGSLGYWLKMQRQLPSRIADPPTSSPSPQSTNLAPESTPLETPADLLPSPVSQSPPSQ